MTVRMYLMAAAAIACFAAGWFGNGWRINSKAQKSTADTLVELQKRMKKQVEDLEAFNGRTAATEAEVIASMRRTQVELRGIRDEIAKSDVGLCRITPDGDRLRDETYRSSVAPKPAP